MHEKVKREEGGGVWAKHVLLCVGCNSIDMSLGVAKKQVRRGEGGGVWAKHVLLSVGCNGHDTSNMSLCLWRHLLASNTLMLMAHKVSTST
jgi:hypothetical protein